MTHFGTNSNTGNAADNADPDGDGSINMDEFIAGTDPKDSSDVLRILSASWQGTGFNLSVGGKAERLYELQLTQDIFSSNWTTVASIGSLRANALVTLIDPAPPTNAAYYRIRVLKP